MTHVHSFIYGDVPGLGLCSCGAYRVWNRFTQSYTEHESEGKSNEANA